jgi:hypothetical protein
VNVADIKRRVTNVLGDDAKLIFEDADLLDMINDAQVDLCRKTGMLSSNLASDAVANKANYDLPLTAIEVKRVTFKGTRLIKTTWQELDMIDPGRDNTTGTPTHFYVDGTDVYLYPTPSTLFAAALNIFYTRIPTVLVNDTDSLEVPVAYHEDIVTRVIARGHEQVEDFQAAQVKVTEYNQAITLAQEQMMDSTEDSYSYIRDTEGPYI